jgi:hypothetical protein
MIKIYATFYPSTIALFAGAALQHHFDIIWKKDSNISTVVWRQFHRKNNQDNITD